MLELVKLNAVVFLPADSEKCDPVKLVIQAEKILSSALSRQLCIVLIGTEIFLVQPAMFLREIAAGSCDDFLLQRIAGELFRIHPVHVDRGDKGSGLWLQNDHIAGGQDNQCLSHRCAAHLQFFGKLFVADRFTRLKLAADDLVPDDPVGGLPGVSARSGSIRILFRVVDRHDSPASFPVYSVSVDRFRAPHRL